MAGSIGEKTLSYEILCNEKTQYFIISELELYKIIFLIHTLANHISLAIYIPFIPSFFAYSIAYISLPSRNFQVINSSIRSLHPVIAINLSNDLFHIGYLLLELHRAFILERYSPLLLHSILLNKMPTKDTTNPSSSYQYSSRCNTAFHKNR